MEMMTGNFDSDIKPSIKVKVNYGKMMKMGKSYRHFVALIVSYRGMVGYESVDNGWVFWDTTSPITEIRQIIGGEYVAHIGEDRYVLYPHDDAAMASIETTIQNLVNMG